MGAAEHFEICKSVESFPLVRVQEEESARRALHLHIHPLALSCFFLGMGWEVGKV